MDTSFLGDMYQNTLYYSATEGARAAIHYTDCQGRLTNRARSPVTLHS